MGCAADATSIATLHAMSAAMSLSTSIYISSLPSMSTATSSTMSSMCDMAIEFVTKIMLFVTFIFVIGNGLGLGFGGPRTFYDDFKTSWIKQFMTKI